MPSRKNEPWAKLTMRVTPKISDKPADTRNSDEAPARPLRSWTSSAEAVTRELWQQRAQERGRATPSAPLVAGTVRAHPIVGRKIARAIGVAPVNHHALA